MTSLPSIRPIGDRPLSLAAHLNRLADLLDAGATPYEWTNSRRCNCGLLVRSLTGWTEDELLRVQLDNPRHSGIWKSSAKEAMATCLFNPTTPLPALFRKLRELGLELEDYAHLEDLNHPKLRSWWSWVVPFSNRRDRPKAVAAYCRRWAKAITRYRAAHPIPDMAAPQPTDTQMEAIETRPLVEVAQ